MPRRKPAVVVEVPAASAAAPEPTPQMSSEAVNEVRPEVLDHVTKGPRVERVGRMTIKYF